ncbi:MAG: periplasmic heavy metal sensor [Alphaproteobacteria bacterium]|nr:MAG: periplasmic heavy metal sensor [Alphaproteobacteria bacterium]
MTDAPSPSRKTVRWLGIALGVSLALNLFIGGYVIGRAFHEPRPFIGLHHGFHQLARDLSPEGQRIVSEVVRDKLGSVRGDLRRVRELRDEIHKLMLADEVDMGALEAALDAMQRHYDAVENAIRTATIAMAERLPVEERRKLRFDWKHKRSHDRAFCDRAPVSPSPDQSD